MMFVNVMANSSVDGRKSSFSNFSVTSPTSQLILQPFRRFTYVTAHYPTLPLLHLHHSSFCNPYFAFHNSQALHLRHLARRPSSATNFIPLFLHTHIILLHQPCDGERGVIARHSGYIGYWPSIYIYIKMNRYFPWSRHNFRTTWPISFRFSF